MMVCKMAMVYAKVRWCETLMCDGIACPELNGSRLSNKKYAV